MPFTPFVSLHLGTIGSWTGLKSIPNLLNTSWIYFVWQIKIHSLCRTSMPRISHLFNFGYVILMCHRIFEFFKHLWYIHHHCLKPSFTKEEDSIPLYYACGACFSLYNIKLFQLVKFLLNTFLFITKWFLNKKLLTKFSIEESRLDILAERFSILYIGLWLLWNHW